jgi:gas vesicle protein
MTNADLIGKTILMIIGIVVGAMIGMIAGALIIPIKFMQGDISSIQQMGKVLIDPSDQDQI